MNMMAPVSTQSQFTVIAAKDAEAFLESLTRTNAETAKVRDILQDAETRADDIVTFASNEADRILSAARAEVEAMEARVAAEAERLAEQSAAAFEAKQNAIEALSAMGQITAIAEDYANLEGWVVETVVSAVRGIVGDMSPQARMAGMIQAAMAKTKERWDLRVTCHPDDYALVLAAVAEGRFEEAIASVQQDPTITPGTCYLKGGQAHFELNLETQISALHQELEHMVAQDDAAVDEEDVCVFRRARPND